MRGIQYLHPETKILAEKLQNLCKSRGLNLLITDTFRTKAEQDKLYAQGRTTAGSIVTNAQYPKSPHNWGVAFDFCKNVKGQEYNDLNFFAEVGALGKSIGLFWGGDFKSFKDRPHLEHLKFMPNQSTSQLISKYGTPDAFKATWTEGGGQLRDLKVTSPMMRGEDVRAIQISLVSLGYNIGTAGIDGIYGNDTAEAVEMLQNNCLKVSVTGIVNDALRKVLGIR